MEPQERTRVRFDGQKEARKDPRKALGFHKKGLEKKNKNLKSSARSLNGRLPPKTVGGSLAGPPCRFRGQQDQRIVGCCPCPKPPLWPPPRAGDTRSPAHEARGWDACRWGRLGGHPIHGLPPPLHALRQSSPAPSQQLVTTLPRPSPTDPPHLVAPSHIPHPPIPIPTGASSRRGSPGQGSVSASTQENKPPQALPYSSKGNAPPASPPSGLPLPRACQAHRRRLYVLFLLVLEKTSGGPASMPAAIRYAPQPKLLIHSRRGNRPSAPLAVVSNPVTHPFLLFPTYTQCVPWPRSVPSWTKSPLRSPSRKPCSTPRARRNGHAPTSRYVLVCV